MCKHIILTYTYKLTYACLCIAMIVYLCTHIDMHKYIYIYIHIYIYIYIYTYIHIYIFTYIYKHIYTYISASPFVGPPWPWTANQAPDCAPTVRRLCANLRRRVWPMGPLGPKGSLVRFEPMAPMGSYICICIYIHNIHIYIY